MKYFLDLLPRPIFYSTGFKPRTSCILGEHSTTQLQLQGL